MPQINDNDMFGPVPTVVNGAQGVGAAFAAGSHDDGGQVSWGTPAAPAAGVIATVTFGTPKAAPVGFPPTKQWQVWVELCAGNAATGALIAAAGTYALVQYNAAGQAIGFTVNAPAAQAANQVAGTYAATYQVIY
jgi:hypothetical protein